VLKPAIKLGLLLRISVIKGTGQRLGLAYHLAFLMGLDEGLRASHLRNGTCRGPWVMPEEWLCWWARRGNCRGRLHGRHLLLIQGSCTCAWKVPDGRPSTTLSLTRLTALFQHAVHHSRIHRDREHQAAASFLHGLRGESLRDYANGRQHGGHRCCFVSDPVAACWGVSRHVQTSFNPPRASNDRGKPHRRRLQQGLAS